MEDLDAALAEVVPVARRLAQREGFKGFSVQDLETIAPGFRFVA